MTLSFLISSGPCIRPWGSGGGIQVIVLHSDAGRTFTKVFVRGIFLYINLSDFPSPHYQSGPALNRKEQSGKSHLLPWQGVTQQNQQTKSSISESESQQPIHSLPLPPTTRKSRLCVDWWPRREGKEAERPTSPERQGYPAAQLIEQRFGHLGHK